MRTRQTCSWCHEVVDTTGGPTLCPTCGHRADVARYDCDCPKCEQKRADDEAAREYAAFRDWWRGGSGE